MIIYVCTWLGDLWRWRWCRLPLLCTFPPSAARPKALSLVPRDPARHKIKLSYEFSWTNLFWFVTEYKVFHTFLGLSPCRMTCSSTMKKCCKGMWSESSILPCFSDVSISSLTTSFEMLTKLLRSTAAGSRAATHTTRVSHSRPKRHYFCCRCFLSLNYGAHWKIFFLILLIFGRHCFCSEISKKMYKYFFTEIVTTWEKLNPFDN